MCLGKHELILMVQAKCSQGETLCQIRVRSGVHLRGCARIVKGSLKHDAAFPVKKRTRVVDAAGGLVTLRTGEEAQNPERASMVWGESFFW